MEAAKQVDASGGDGRPEDMLGGMLLIAAFVAASALVILAAVDAIR